jgi:AcrR family transcriptional regulator
MGDEMQADDTGKKEEKAPRGRPRSAKVHQAIVDATLQLVFEVGFRALNMDTIATKAGVGKMTIYRRWPNKAALVMDAFLATVGRETEFPEAARATDSIQLQMRLQAKAFRSRFGRVIKALLGEAQFDREVAEAFRDRWIIPRRRMARNTIERAIREGDLRIDIDPEAAIDMLYAPIYYRLQIGTGPISETYTDWIFEQVMRGLRKPPNS